MERQLSYREWLEASKASLDAARRRFGGDPDAEAPEYDMTGHPLNPLLPPTGDDEYDAGGARMQLHSRAAQEAAGIDRRDLDRIRRALDAGEDPPLPPGWRHLESRPEGNR
jgi:hypothetical protein